MGRWFELSKFNCLKSIEAFVYSSLGQCNVISIYFSLGLIEVLGGVNNGLQLKDCGLHQGGLGITSGLSA